jgi:hypothetical protein
MHCLSVAAQKDHFATSHHVSWSSMLDVLEEGWEGEEMVERGRDGDIEEDEDSSAAGDVTVRAVDEDADRTWLAAQHLTDLTVWQI